MRVLLLCEDEIASLLSIGEVMDAVENAFKEYALGYVQMPPKLYLSYPEDKGDLRTMPCYIERLEVSAVKIVNSHPENPKKFGLPTVMAIVILTDPKNGQPLAIMSGRNITAMRTAAAGGIAAKYLARKESRVVGLVGAGVQARTQLLALCSVYENLEKVKVWDISSSARKNYVDEMQPRFAESKIVSVNRLRDAVEGADIIVTTTPSRKPLVMNDWVPAGVHINCIGADAPGKQELDPAILQRAKIVVDCWEQALHGGEINVPLTSGLITKDNVWAELGEIVAGFKSARTLKDEVTVFDSTGLAIQDAATAGLAYKKALKNGVGRFVDM